MGKSQEKSNSWKRIERGIRAKEHPTRKHGPRPDIYYVLRFRVGDEDIQEALGWASEGWTLTKARYQLALLKEAKKIGEGPLTLKEKRQQAIKEREEESSKLTIRQLWEFYDEAKADRAVKRTDTYNFKHLDKPLGDIRAEDLRTEHIENLQEDLEKKNLSPQTVKHVLGLLRRILRYGEKRGKCVIPSPKLLTIEMPHVDNIVTECLTPAEIKRLLKVLDEEKDQIQASIMRFALATGIRKSAILGLQWDHVDFEKKTIMLSGIIAKSGKTSYVPMNEAARKILEALPRSSSPYVFPGKDGGKRYDIRRMAARVKKKARRPKSFRPLHGLRHTFACNLANSGKVTLQTIQALLTHSNASVTERYAHLSDNILREASEVAATGLEIHCKNDEEAPDRKKRRRKQLREQ